MLELTLPDEFHIRPVTDVFLMRNKNVYIPYFRSNRLLHPVSDSRFEAVVYDLNELGKCVTREFFAYPCTSIGEYEEYMIDVINDLQSRVYKDLYFQ